MAEEGNGQLIIDNGQRTATKAKLTHKAEVEAIRLAVGYLGGVCNVTSQGHRLRGSAGIPDLYVQLTRKPWLEAFWVEVKVGRDKLSPVQAEFMQREVAAGGTVVVGGLEDVLAAIGRMRNGCSSPQITQITQRKNRNGKAVR